MTKAELIVKLYDLVEVENDIVGCRKCHKLRLQIEKVLSEAKREVLIEEGSSSIRLVAQRDSKRSELRALLSDE